MIKLIIHCADLHIHNFQRYDEYASQFTQFIDKCRDIAKNYNKDEIRIVISGDLFESRNDISNEALVFAASFIRQIESIARVIIIAGNHDLVMNNTTRKDSMTALFETANFSNTVFADQFLGYESGTLIDNNVIWALYSIYSDYRRPDIESAKKQNTDANHVIGLYHGAVIGSTLNNGNVMEDGTDGDAFDGCQIVMAGHIHKRQELKRKDTIIVYPGSLIQQTFGETVTQHGFCLWHLDENKHEFIDLQNDYGLYNFNISSIDDFDNGNEILMNY